MCVRNSCLAITLLPVCIITNVLQVRMLLSEALMEPNGITYPLPELFTGVGFFVILFLEKFVLLCRDQSEKKRKSKDAAIRVADPGEKCDAFELSGSRIV